MPNSNKKSTATSRGLADVLATAEIHSRPARMPDVSAEHAALQKLANGLKGDPDTLLLQIAELAHMLCDADTAGISGLNGNKLRWLSVSGTYSRYTGLTMSCTESPCGICLQHGDAQLFTAPERYFTTLATVSPQISELLITPFYTNDNTLSATLWIASHDVQRHFDAKDLRILTTLAGFAAVALRLLQTDHITPDTLYSSCTEPPIPESSVQEAVPKLEAILDTVADGIVSIDEHGRIESANHAAERIFGYTAAELLGNNVSMLMPEPESSLHDSYLQRYLNSGKHIGSSGTRREVMGRRSDGSIFPLEITINEPHLSGRRIFTGILHDITERRQAEAALRESEERFRLFIEYAPAAIAMFDRDMRHLAVSRRFLDDYHVKETDIIGRSHYEIFPDIPERWREFHQRGLQGEVLRAEEDRFERADGSVQWTRWEIHPWYTGNYDIGGIVLFTEDISARKNAEFALRESEEFGRQIIAGIQEGLAVFDRELRYRVWNHYMEEMSGISAPEVLGKHPDEIFPWMREQGIVNYLERSLAGESILHPDTSARHGSNGQTVYISARTSPLRNSQGEIIGVVAVLQDITERKRTEDDITRHLQELRRANEELARFNRAAVDREMRMVELKQQVNELCARNGLPQRYRVDFDAHTPWEES